MQVQCSGPMQVTYILNPTPKFNRVRPRVQCICDLLKVIWVWLGCYGIYSISGNFGVMEILVLLAGDKNTPN